MIDGNVEDWYIWLMGMLKIDDDDVWLMGMFKMIYGDVVGLRWYATDGNLVDLWCMMMNNWCECGRFIMICDWWECDVWWYIIVGNVIDLW